MNSVISLISKKLRSAGFTLKGCTREEIETYQNSNELKFPKVYTEFLLTMGKNAGDFMRGSDYEWDELPELKNAANETLADNKLPPLTQEDFVFFMHQGYIFAFFKIGEGEDPKIYLFSEGDKKGVHIKYGSLSDFFHKQYLL